MKRVAKQAGSSGEEKAAAGRTVGPLTRAGRRARSLQAAELKDKNGVGAAALGLSGVLVRAWEARRRAA